MTRANTVRTTRLRSRCCVSEARRLTCPCAGYSYVSSERPLANVPYSILSAENFFGYNGQLFCNQNATFNNLTCSNPPEQVQITWMTQNVVSIDTKATTHTLNFYIRVQWRDWRLSYTEGGVTCFNSTTAPIRLTGLGYKQSPGRLLIVWATPATRGDGERFARTYSSRPS